MTLQARIEELFSSQAERYGDEYFQTFDELKAALNQGRIRAAEPDQNASTGWKVNPWVKQGILLGFRIGRIVEMSPVATLSEAVISPSVAAMSPSPDKLPDARQSEAASTRLEPATKLASQFRDKHTYPLKPIPAGQNIRVVPGGSSIRDGCYIGKGVVCMPPMYVNVGAYVDEGTLIDSHALVGSCAQIGQRCHLSAGAQIGGVLEPVGAMPVIIEDDVLVGGNCGVYEGTIVRAGAVLAAGTILTGSTPVYDLVRDKVYRREVASERSNDSHRPLMIPPGAVVVPGARAITRGRGKEMGLSLYTPVIIKYRDEKTDQAVRLEELLR
jgi:2,3,4,5-tetrahydropyridine-2-carboxylate N-succinyltransferase